MVQSSNGTKVELARGTYLGGPQWSPDGSEILFWSWRVGTAPDGPSTRKVYISYVSRLGGVAHPINTGNYACWFASDGSLIVTGKTAEPYGFKGFSLVNKLTGEVKEVRLSEYTWLLDVDCSARAGLILAVTNTSGKFQIRVFKPDGGEEHTLVEDKDEIYAARWSPAGDYIYYLHGKGSTQVSFQSFHGNPTTRAEPTVLANGLQTGGDFTVSADGVRLAYTREDHTSNLWGIDLPSAGRGQAKPKIQPHDIRHFSLRRTSFLS